MSPASLIDVSSVERARIADVVRRLVGVRGRGLWILGIGFGGAAQLAGWQTVIPSALAVLLLPVLRRLARGAAHPERHLMLALLISQLSILAGLALAGSWGILGLGLLVLPVVAASVLLPARVLSVVVLASVVLLIGGGLLIDLPAVQANPSLLLIPLGILVTVAVPGAAVRTADESTRGAAVADALTGALNRLALEARVGELTARGSRSVGVLAADLDSFKRINDAHGHAVGDAVLRGVVGRMRDELAGSVPIYRVGGEEFVLVTEDVGELELALLAERIRAAVAASPIAGLDVTISLGVAAGDLTARSFDVVLADADDALYDAKRSGRDRVVCAARMTASGVGVPSPQLAAATPGSAHHAGGAGSGQPTGVPSPARLRSVRAALEDADGRRLLAASELERRHLRALVVQLRRTHRAAFVAVFGALLLSMPWLGWKLFVPAALAIPVYVLVERRLDRFRRPELALALAWLSVQSALVAGAALASAPDLHLGFLFLPMLVGTSAVFPARGVTMLGAATALLVLVGALVAVPETLLAHPSLIALAVSLLAAVSLCGAVTGRSALDHRAGGLVDPLSGLLNRAALGVRVGELSHLAQLERSHVSVVVCDLDGLKAVNDARGHAVGDEVIQAVGAAMRAHLQGYEWAFRVGGDEFVVLLPHGSIEAAAITERLRSVVAELRIDGIPVSGSFGIATSSRPGDFDFDATFRLADAACLLAKRRGRNQIVRHGEPVAG